MPDNNIFQNVSFSKETFGGYNRKEVDDYLRWLAGAIQRFEDEQKNLYAELQRKDNQIKELQEKTADFTERLYKHRQTIQELTENLEDKEEELAAKQEQLRELKKQVGGIRANTAQLENKLKQTEEKLAVREQELYRTKSELARQKHHRKEKRTVVTFSPLTDGEIRNLSGNHEE